MAALPYTKKLLIQRIRKQISNSRFIDDDFPASDNEILLIIDQKASFRIVGNVYAQAKIEGALVMPEAYLITYNLGNLTQDTNTLFWYTTLPQPPLSLPLGYSITDAYFIYQGKTQSAFPVKSKRVSIRDYMPKPRGIFVWIEGNKIWARADDNSMLNGVPLYVQMPSARTTDINAVMNMPEDDIDFVFTETVKVLLQRYGVPQDIIKDDLPAGNKSS